jgi:hypothetical protein
VINCSEESTSLLHEHRKPKMMAMVPKIAAVMINFFVIALAGCLVNHSGSK